MKTPENDGARKVPEFRKPGMRTQRWRAVAQRRKLESVDSDAL